jgi:hypothetical protein
MAMKTIFSFLLNLGFFENKMNNKTIPIQVTGDNKKNKTFERIKNIITN